MSDQFTDDPTAERRAILVRTLGEPYGAEKPLAVTISSWLSTGELATLVGWFVRACDARTTRVGDLLVRVGAALSGASRDEHGNYVLTIGATLTRHLLDEIGPEGNER